MTVDVDDVTDSDNVGPDNMGVDPGVPFVNQSKLGDAGSTDVDRVAEARLKAAQRQAIDSTKTDSPDGDDERFFRVLTPTTDWFRSMLRGFLLVYVVGLGAISSWFRNTTSHRRLWVVVAVLLPFLHQLAFRPLGRRLAFRSLRRRSSTLSLGIALGVGATIVSTSLTVSDAVWRSQDDLLARHLGPLDAVVVTSSPGDRLIALAAIEKHESELESRLQQGPQSVRDSTDGQLLMSSVRVTASSATQRLLNNIDAIEVDIAEASRFGADAEATGLAGLAPLAAGDVYVGSALARSLRVVRGSTIDIRAGSTPLRVRVAGVLPTKGLAAVSLFGATQPRVMFVSPGTVDTVAAANNTVSRFLIGYSIAGRAEQTWKRSRGLAETLNQVFAAGLVTNPDPVTGTPPPGEIDLAFPAEDIAVAPTRVNAYATGLKADLRDNVARSVVPLAPISSSLAAIAGATGALCVVAALALTLLRRRRELHSLRALGLNRGDAFGVAFLELTTLSLLAVISGSAIGWLIGREILGRAAASTSKMFGGLGLDFAPRLEALSTSLSATFLLCMVMIGIGGLASVRGHLGVGLRSESPLARLKLTRSLWVGFAFLGVLVAAFGIAKRADVAVGVGAVLLLGVPTSLGPAAVRTNLVRRVALVLVGIVGIVGMLGALRRSALSPAAFAFFSLLLLAVAVAVSRPLQVWVRSHLPQPVQSVFASIDIQYRHVSDLVRLQLGPARQSVASLLRALVDRARTLPLVGSRLGHRVSSEWNSQSSTTVNDGAIDTAGLRALLERSSRDHRGLHGFLLRMISALALFATIVASVVSSSVAGTISQRARDAQGRFGGVVFATDPSMANGIRAQADVAQVSQVKSRAGELSDATHTGVRVTVASPDDVYSSGVGVSRLVARAPQYGSDEAVFKALLSDQKIGVVDRSILGSRTPNQAVGKDMFLNDQTSGRSLSFTVVGVTSSASGLGEVVVGPLPFALFERDGEPSSHHSLVHFAPGTSVRTDLSEIQSLFGTEALSFADVTANSLRGERTVASLLAQLSRLLLLTGLGSGLVVLRTALADRRRDLAGLRVLGATDPLLRDVVSRDFARDALSGLGVGVVLGLFGAWRLLRVSALGLSMSVPIVGIGATLLILVVVGRWLLRRTVLGALRESPAAVLRNR